MVIIGCGLEATEGFYIKYSCAHLYEGKTREEMGCHFLLRGFSYPGIESTSLASLTLTGRFFTIRGHSGKPIHWHDHVFIKLWINQILISSFIQQIIFEHLLLPDPVPFNQRKTFFLGAEEMLARRQRSSCPYAVNLMKPFLHGCAPGKQKVECIQGRKDMCSSEPGYLDIQAWKGQRKQEESGTSLVTQAVTSGVCSRR